jgi:hypothetical protein
MIFIALVVISTVISATLLLTYCINMNLISIGDAGVNKGISYFDTGLAVFFSIASLILYYLFSTYPNEMELLVMFFGLLVAAFSLISESFRKFVFIIFASALFYIPIYGPIFVGTIVIFFANFFLLASLSNKFAVTIH